MLSVLGGLMDEGMKECDNVFVMVAPPYGHETQLLTEDVVRRTRQFLDSFF